MEIALLAILLFKGQSLFCLLNSWTFSNSSEAVVFDFGFIVPIYCNQTKFNGFFFPWEWKSNNITMDHLKIKSLKNMAEKEIVSLFHFAVFMLKKKLRQT